MLCTTGLILIDQPAVIIERKLKAKREKKPPAVLSGIGSEHGLPCLLFQCGRGLEKVFCLLY